VKNVEYTELTSANRERSDRYTVTLAQSDMEYPADSAIALTFSNARAACSFVPSGIVPVTGSTGN